MLTIMRLHRKPKTYVTSIPQENILTDAMKGDIVFETVEEILSHGNNSLESSDFASCRLDWQGKLKNKQRLI